MRYLLITPILIYKLLVSPVIATYFGHACRFSPTCSEYSQKAILKYGIKGVILSLRRILSCNGSSTKYFDPLV